MSKVKAAKKAQKASRKDVGGGGGKGEERGLMSSAGLMRYYDVEESAIQFSPRTIVVIGIALAVVVLGLEIYFGVWPPA
ncbi:Preprotein translocase subunit Sec61beta [Candidatus Methanophagaceae archaeon]|nr:Preprotein translocase subunit Sec61beta [Methanophagales archaeon]